MRHLLALSALAVWLAATASPVTADQTRGRGRATGPAPAAAPASPAMTNADVVKMLKAGLGEDIVISAIRTAKERSFTLSADGLVQLKMDGVSDRVIAVMLDPTAPPAAPVARTTAATPPPASAPAPPPTGSFGGSTVSPASAVAEVQLVTSSGMKPVSPEGGDMSSSYAFVKMIVWANFRGLKADVRTTDKRPGLLIKVTDPKFNSRFLLVKTEEDEDDNVRSVKIKSGVYTVSTAFVPDSDWIIPTKAEEQSPGVWLMTPNKELGRGEWGVLDAQNRYLYGFAIDK